MNMTTDKLNETLRELARLTVEESRACEGLVRWVVVSAIDSEIYGPFEGCTKALKAAAHMDGSIIELSAKEV
jgi:hypothetical protein